MVFECQYRIWNLQQQLIRLLSIADESEYKMQPFTSLSLLNGQVPNDWKHTAQTKRKRKSKFKQINLTTSNSDHNDEMCIGYLQCMRMQLEIFLIK
ncbi:hypothetical protein T12_10056 [Trichinella patagoniensis]|uniref:Uncharacterized protein n=1 Tax=Trichinella patagoniensis TaxID=990121 RepID=A0A0V1A1L4_9BILA|nr:hypothetical protein T12_10056 [Trichinella patagoniensis]